MSPSLRQIVLNETGQDLRRCRNCAKCNDKLNNALLPSPGTGEGSDVLIAGVKPDGDISIEALVQLVMLNDEEVLTSRTVWSDIIQQASRNACQRGLDLSQVIAALRREALRRGISR